MVALGHHKVGLKSDCLPNHERTAALGLDALLIAILIGLGAGLIGGLCGIGGSIVMLPALGIVFGYKALDGTPDPQRSMHHVYMAAAMIVNVVIGFASSFQHTKAKANAPGVVRKALPSMVLGVVLGVLISNTFEGTVSKLALAGFLILAGVWTAVSAIRKLPDPPADGVKTTWLRLGPISLGTGFLAGFLGIGGGIVLVPLLQLVPKVPLKSSIAASASIMRISSVIGASLKLATLSTLTIAVANPVQQALSLGGAMAIGGLVGALLGARLTHMLPLRELRLVLAVVLAVAAAKLAGLV